MVAVEPVEVKEVPLEQTKVLIESYLKEQFKKQQRVYPSDVADVLKLNYETVHKVFDDLEREGKSKRSGKDHVTVLLEVKPSRHIPIFEISFINKKRFIHIRIKREGLTPSPYPIFW